MPLSSVVGCSWHHYMIARPRPSKTKQAGAFDGSDVPVPEIGPPDDVASSGSGRPALRRHGRSYLELGRMGGSSVAALPLVTGLEFAGADVEVQAAMSGSANSPALFGEWLNIRPAASRQSRAARSSRTGPGHRGHTNGRLRDT